ncbi:MAG: NB-ARC domain-containing protein [Acidimicrobiia bacterium]|nr:NB-ARC domain-containing protein [Acidimicrobiia bacterium]
MHTGTAEERDGDYFGTSVNRAARVAGVADGGQVLVTDAVRLLVSDAAPDSLGFVDLGEHRLRDLLRPERLWQLRHPDLPHRPASMPARGPRGNIGPSRSPLLGRNAALQRVEDLFEGTRLVTLLGVGGVGKTKLARAFARRVADRYDAGLWFVDLSAVGDETAVAAAVATALEVSERPGMSVLDSVLDALSIGRRLVVMDNAEHLVAGTAGLVDAVLSHPTSCDLIVTSREALGVEGEVVYRVEPLGIGDDAVELFRSRARRVASDLTLDDVGTIREICRRLDGLPLAIELAAAQCDVMTPAEILAGLEDRSLALRTPGRGPESRHSSLEDTVRWSYEMLDERDRLVFDRLSVFTGSATQDAICSVCSGGGLGADDVAAALRELVRKSLVVVSRGRSTRFSLLETLRHFGNERLEERGGTEATARRHADWYAAVSRRAAVAVNGSDEASAVDGLLADLDNLRGALAWASDAGEVDVLGGIGAGLPHLMAGKMRPELFEWADSTIDLMPADHPGRTAYAMVVALGTLFSGRFDEAVERIHRETEGVADLADAQGARNHLTLVAAFFSGDIETVVRDTPAQIELAMRTTFAASATSIGADLALAQLYRGEVDDARATARRLLDLGSAAGNPSMLAWAQYTQGEIDAEVDPDAAIDRFEEAIELGVSVHNEFVASISLIALAATTGRHGKPDTALTAMERCVTFWRGAGYRSQMWTTIRNLIELLHRLGRDEDALTLHAAVEAHRDEAPELFGPYGEQHRRIVVEIEDVLGADAAAVRSRGARLGYEAAAELAMQVIERAREDLAGS